jgi:hypothetical protein
MAHGLQMGKNGVNRKKQKTIKSERKGGHRDLYPKVKS